MTPPSAQQVTPTPALDRAVRRVVLTGEGAETLLGDIEAAGLEVVTDSSDADLVISYGGDGSLLGCDRQYPHLPKMPVRRNHETIKCPVHENRAVFKRVVQGQSPVTYLPRLRVEVRGKVLYAINDIVFRNALVTAGVRYRVKIDGTAYSGEIVGDGVIVATPFGSSAYYRAITKSVIRTGVGLAFNNSTEAINHLVLKDEAEIEIEITRGPAVVVADNMCDPIEISRGDLLQVRMSMGCAAVWELGALTCNDCIDRATGRGAGYRHV